MDMMPLSSEQKKTFKMETPLGITRNILWKCDKITTFCKLNLLLQSVWLLAVCNMALVKIIKMHLRLWYEMFRKRQ